MTAAMLATHRLLGTWSGTVDKYITLSAFARDKFAEAGLPAAKLTVKANFVEVDPGVGEHDGGYVLFAGRLVEGKGVGLLMKAWSKIPDIPLRIAGDGPLQSQVNSTLGNGSGQLTFLGWASRERIIDLLKGAALLVFPSECYEGFPMLIAEAYACGTPVIASRLGAMREIVTDGKTGLHFTPGDSGDLAAKIQWAWEHADARAQMGINARAEYEAKYTAEENYQMLTAIYRQVLA